MLNLLIINFIEQPQYTMGLKHLQEVCILHENNRHELAFVHKTALLFNYPCINYGSQKLENGDLDKCIRQYKININNNFLFYKSLNLRYTILHFLQTTLGTNVKIISPYKNCT
jgi:hypothetical protein